MIMHILKYPQCNLRLFLWERVIYDANSDTNFLRGWHMMPIMTPGFLWERMTYDANNGTSFMREGDMMPIMTLILWERVTWCQWWHWFYDRGWHDANNDTVSSAWLEPVLMITSAVSWPGPAIMLFPCASTQCLLLWCVKTVCVQSLWLWQILPLPQIFINCIYLYII